MKKINYYIIISIIVLTAGCSLNGSYDPKEGDPTYPSNPVPTANSADRDLVLTLSWTAQNAVSFDVYFDKQSPPVNVIAHDTNTTSLTVFGLDYNTVYFWKVVSKFNDGTERSGDVWGFQTKPKFTSADGTLFHKKFDNTELPSTINIMFTVTDRGGKGIPFLSENNFSLIENGEEIKITDSVFTLVDKSKYDYSFHTVLMIDNTVSSSVQLEDIKNAAQGFVVNKDTKQQIAIYQFSDGINLLQDFTSDSDVLSSAISNLSFGGSQTNFYGAVIEGANKIDELFSTDKVVQGALVIFSYNNDTKGENILEEAISSLQNKICYTIGMAKSYNPFIYNVIGNRGFFPALESGELSSKFTEVQSLVQRLSAGFYRVKYSSPQRGDNQNILKIKFKDNVWQGGDSELTVMYNSVDFYSAAPGLYINSTIANPTGIDSLSLFSGLERTLRANSFHALSVPSYTWVIGNSNIVKITDDPSDNSRVKVKAVGSAGERTVLVITDLNNGLQKLLTIIIE